VGLLARDKFHKDQRGKFLYMLQKLLKYSSMPLFEIKSF